MAGLTHMEAEVRNATFATDLNPFAIPVGPPYNVFSAGSRVNASNFIGLRIFVNGVGGVSWNSPSFLVLDVSQDMDIQRLQPVSFTGRSDGFYSTPYT